MPKISEKRINLESNWFSAERDVTRSKGLHLSHVIDYIEYLEGKRELRGQEGLSDAGHAYSIGGFAWEHVISNLIERNPVELWEWLFTRALNTPDNPLVVRPGEQSMDGGLCPVCQGKGSTYTHLTAPVVVCGPCHGTGKVIIFMTPDGYHIEDMILEEYKYTSKGWREGCITDKKFSRWVEYQIPCYLKALNLNTCRLRVYFVRGDYKEPVPRWYEYTITFSNQELDETWDLIAQHARLMYKEGIV